MATNAGNALTSRFEQQIIKAFRDRHAVSGQSAQRLRDMGLKDSPVLRAMITAAVLRRAGPERYYLDEAIWATRRNGSPLYLATVVGAVLLGIMLIGLFLASRP